MPDETGKAPPPSELLSRLRQLPFGRILSALICAAYIVATFVAGPYLLSQMAALYGFLGGCLVLIWHPEEFDDLLGNTVTLFNLSYEGVVYRASNRTLIVGAGWILLVGLPVLLGFLGR